MRKLSQNISSRSLFHFVEKIEYMIDILTNGFQARYCFERSPLGHAQLAVPMKCFCDIPLGLIKKHINRYGKFGVGITKEYAKGVGISPVIYVHENAVTLKAFLNAYKGSKPDELPALYSYFKTYDEIQLVNRRRRYLNYYDEREWRYIPNNAIYPRLDVITPKPKLNDQLNKLNKDLPAHYRVKLPREAISYLFVESEMEIKKVINEIRKLDSDREQQDLLIAKIITSNQIQGDF